MEFIRPNRDLESADQIRSSWPLTQEEITLLEGQDLIKKRLGYLIYMSGEGPNHYGKVSTTVVWLYRQSYNHEWEEVGRTINPDIPLTPTHNVSIILFALNQYPAIAMQIITAFGGMPEIVLPPTPTPTPEPTPDVTPEETPEPTPTPTPDIEEEPETTPEPTPTPTPSPTPEQEE